MDIVDINAKKEELAIQNLLDVYIQDPVNNCGYLITAETLHKCYKTCEKNESKNCITFVIPDLKSLTSVIPDIQQSNTENPSIKIFDMASQNTYVVPHEDLNKFKVSLDAFNPHGISFIMPIKSELIEDMPFLMRGLLQVQEHYIIPRIKQNDVVSN